jgi:cell division protein FtsW
LWGVGLGRGFQKLSFLPEANTDFVFAVIGEELGLLGGLSVIGLWLGVYVAGLRLISRLERQSFAHNAAFVLLTQLIFQVTLNVAVVTAMVPPKGIPHPLISYGGSNLVVSLVALGVVMSLTRT